MNRWFLTGILLLSLTLIIVGMVDSGTYPPSLPDTVDVLQNLKTIDSLNSLLELYRQLPADVILIIFLFLVSGIVVNVKNARHLSDNKPKIIPGWLGIFGSITWTISALGMAIIGGQIIAEAYWSSFWAHYLSGFFLQVTLLASVIVLLLTPLTRQEINFPLNNLDWVDSLKIGTIEYLKLYPYLLVALVFNEWLIGFFFSPTIPPSYRFIASSNFLLQNVALFVLLSILAPIAEELFFRGILFGSFRDYFPLLPSAAIAGGLFALLHGEFQSVLPLWLLGSYLCYVYERSGSIKVVITMHFLQNTVSLYMLKRLLNPI